MFWHLFLSRNSRVTFILQPSTRSLPRTCSTNIAIIFSAPVGPGGLGGLSARAERAEESVAACSDPAQSTQRVMGEQQRGHCSGALPGGTGRDALCSQNAVERGWFSVSLVAAANLVLHQTVERIHVGKKYGDIPRGIFVVRGENVVLLGEIDLEKESDTPLQQVSIEEILEEQRVEQQAKQESEKLKVQALKERGLSVPRADTLDEY